MRIKIFLFLTILISCADTSLIVPVGGPMSVKDENGREVRECQAVIVNGKPETECDKLSMRN